MADLRIVVGVDGSSHAREALRWAYRLTGVLGGEVVVVHALGLLERLHGDLVVANQHRAEIEQVLEWEWCAPLRGDGIGVRTVVREGHPVEVLLEVAEEEEAGLIVMGTRGGGSSAALALGSTSLHVLRTAQVPVLVVPDRENSARHLGLRRIVVGADGLPSSEAALEVACEVAVAFDAWVTVVEAVDDLVASLEERLGPELRQRVAGHGVPAHVAVRCGRPEQVVRSVSAAIDADLVVTGRRRGREGTGLLAGSVSRQVVRAVHRPTLVVPEGCSLGRLLRRQVAAAEVLEETAEPGAPAGTAAGRSFDA